MADAFKACAVDGCNRNALKIAGGCRGWCSAHYNRWRRHGDPAAGRTMEGAPLAFLESTLSTQMEDCVRWPYGRGPDGQGRVWIKGRPREAARVVCERAQGAPPTPQHEAAHSCGKGHEGCINPRHIRWATHIDNEADKLIHGTLPQGQRHGKAKLTEQVVIEVRRRAATGLSLAALAREYGVSRQAIADVIRRRSWGWLK